MMVIGRFGQSAYTRACRIAKNANAAMPTIDDHSRTHFPMILSHRLLVLEICKRGYNETLRRVTSKARMRRSP
jgi:hypothetical protein